MRKAVQLVGLYLLAAGISGTIDHLAFQPFFGVFLNAFNRFVIPRLDFLTGYEVFANLTVAAIGGVLVIAAERMGRPS
jgi:hypothetical protein